MDMSNLLIHLPADITTYFAANGRFSPRIGQMWLFDFTANDAAGT